MLLCSHAGRRSSPTRPTSTRRSSSTIFRERAMRRSGVRGTGSRESARRFWRSSCASCLKSARSGRSRSRSRRLARRHVHQKRRSYRRRLPSSLRETRVEQLRIPNKAFDTGKDTHAGEYQLTDKAYERLLDQLTNRTSAHLTPQLQENILEFYADLNAPIWTKQRLADIEKLRAAPASPVDPVTTSGTEDQEFILP